MYYYDVLAPGFEKFVQEEMLAALEIMMIDHASYDTCIKIINSEKLTDEENKELMKGCKGFFPSFYNPLLYQQTLMELYAMIASEDYYIPDLIQEYVLGNSIEDRAFSIEEIKKSDPSYNGYRMEHKMRKPLKERLIKHYIEEDVPEKEAVDMAEETITGYEDCSRIIEDAFHDVDYTLLDDFTSQELYENGMDKLYGIGALEPARKINPDGTAIYVGEPEDYENIVVSIKI